MQKLIFDLAELDSTGKHSFVDTSMQSNDPMMDEAYGKVVFQQQLFPCNTTHHVITKVSHSTMEEISAQFLVLTTSLTSIPQTTLTIQALGKFCFEHRLLIQI